MVRGAAGSGHVCRHPRYLSGVRIVVDCRPWDSGSLRCVAQRLRAGPMNLAR